MSRPSAAETLAKIRPKLAQFPTEVQEFLRHRAQGYALGTIMGHIYDFEVFFRWLAKERLGIDKPLEEIDWDKVLDWEKHIHFKAMRSFLHYLISYESTDRHGNRVTRENSMRGINRKFASLSALFSYLTLDGILSENPLGDRERRNQLLNVGGRTMKPKDIPVYLTVEESEQLLESVKSHEQRYIHSALRERDNALLYLLLMTGARASEVAALNKNSIEYGTVKIMNEDGTYEIRQQAYVRIHGKGGKTRLVPLNPVAEHWIQVYLASRPHQDHEALFLTRTGRRIDRKTIYDIVTKYAREAGIPPKEKNISPHKLRHTFATTLLQHGKATLQEIQELLGHENIQTTNRYAHVAKQRLFEAVAAHPLAERGSKGAAQPPPPDENDTENEKGGGT